MGFLSTVPSNAGDLLKAAASAARKSGNFPGKHLGFKEFLIASKSHCSDCSYITTRTYRFAYGCGHRPPWRATGDPNEVEI